MEAAGAAARTTAIFGGTFDPVHLGHLILAEQVAESERLEQVLLVPAGRPPHKEGRTQSPARHRLAMLERAIAGNPRLGASAIELGPDLEGGPPARPSYTIDTVRRLKAEGARDVALILGADSLVELGTWREPEALAAECRLLVVERPGVDLGAAPAPFRRRATLVRAPLIAISSSEVRRRVGAGLSIRYLVPESVREYILEHGLYRDA